MKMHYQEQIQSNFDRLTQKVGQIYGRVKDRVQTDHPTLFNNLSIGLDTITGIPKATQQVTDKIFPGSAAINRSIEQRSTEPLQRFGAKLAEQVTSPEFAATAANPLAAVASTKIAPAAKQAAPKAYKGIKGLVKPLLKEARKYKSAVDSLYKEFENAKLGDRVSITKTNGTAKDLKNKTLSSYPLTDNAKKLLEEKVKPKLTPNEDFAAAEKIGTRTEVSIHEKKPTNMFHEFFHAIFNHDPSIKKILPDFQKEFDVLKPNNLRLQLIDKILEKDKANYGKSSPNWLQEERWAYVGEMYGQAGLNAIPKELQPFYKSQLKDK